MIDFIADAFVSIVYGLLLVFGALFIYNILDNKSGWDTFPTAGVVGFVAIMEYDKLKEKRNARSSNSGKP